MAPSLSITNPVLNQPKHSKPNRYSPENLREILGLHKGCLRVFSVPQQSIRPGPSCKYRYRFSANTDIGAPKVRSRDQNVQERLERQGLLATPIC